MAIPITEQSIGDLERMMRDGSQMKRDILKLKWIIQQAYFDLDPILQTDAERMGVQCIKQCSVCHKVKDWVQAPDGEEWCVFPGDKRALPYASHTYCPDCCAREMATLKGSK